MSGFDDATVHEPVLVEEVMDLLAPAPGEVFVDATVGGGGHAAVLLGRLGDNGLLLGLDRDGDAIARCRARLAGRGERCRLAQGAFSRIAEIVHGQGWAAVDGVLMDIGLSSDQLEHAERGMSFLLDGPLDMRMDRTGATTAADLVNGLPEERLRSILWGFGEERRARRIAAAIAARRAQRPFETTADLAAVVENAAGGRRGRIHPATRTFQALRIAVNDELEELSAGLAGALSVLRVGGRMGVISFHSLEDRIVKRFFADHTPRELALQQGGTQRVGEAPPVERVNRKPVTASAAECERNPRSRSARLRVVQRTG